MNWTLKKIAVILNRALIWNLVQIKINKIQKAI